MKKPVISLILAAGLLAVLATGCSSGGTSSAAPASSAPESTPASSAAPVKPESTPAESASAAESSSAPAREGTGVPIEVEKAVVYDHFFSSVGVEEMEDGMVTAQVVITGGEDAIYKDWRDIMNYCTLLSDGQEIGAYIQGADVSIGEEQSFGMRFWVPADIDESTLEFVMDGEAAGMPEIYYTVDGFTRQASNEAELEADSSTEAAA